MADGDRGDSQRLEHRGIILHPFVGDAVEQADIRPECLQERTDCRAACLPAQRHHVLASGLAKDQAFRPMRRENTQMLAYHPFNSCEAGKVLRVDGNPHGRALT